jgi:hypothetical protein
MLRHSFSLNSECKLLPVVILHRYPLHGILGMKGTQVPVAAGGICFVWLQPCHTSMSSAAAAARSSSVIDFMLQNTLST